MSENTIENVSIKPISTIKYEDTEQEKQEEQDEQQEDEQIKPSAPRLVDCFPISEETEYLYWYIIFNEPELKLVYSNYSMEIVLECININPLEWYKLSITEQEKYLNYYTELNNAIENQQEQAREQE